MPLSEEEMRLLEQMERALVEEDPKFAHTLRGTVGQQASRRRAVIAGIVFAVGVAVLMTGAVAALPLVGVAGFVVMLVSATVAVTALKSPEKAAPAEFRETAQGFGVVDGGRRGQARGSKSRSRHSFMERMDERWRRRRDGY